MRCVPIARISRDEWTSKKKGRFSKRHVERTELLLTQDGKILKWGWNAEIVRGSIEFARWSEITFVQGEERQSILSRPDVAQQVLHQLNVLVGRTIEKREKWLTSLKDLRTTIDFSSHIKGIA